MTSGQVLQIYAIVIAVAIPLAAAVGVFRFRRWSYAILAAQSFLLLEVGAVAYAVSPDTEPRMSPVLWLAAALVIVDALVIGWAMYRRRKLLRGPITLAQLDRSNDRAWISRGLTVLVVSAVLLNFEPWLGVANLAGNVLWTFLWIPQRMRAYGMEVSVEIAAPTHVVFPYLVDPAKWPLYRSKTDLQLVTVKPPGRLAVGTQVVTRRPVSVGKRFKPYLLESTSEVTALTPDRSFSTVWVDRPSEHALMQLDDGSSGTSLLFRVQGIQPFWSGALGLMFDVRSILAARRAETSRNFVRLKDILEAAPSQ